MPASHHIDGVARLHYLECTAPSGLADLDHAVTILLAEADFDAAGGVLLELGSGTELLAPPRSFAIAEIFSRYQEQLRGPIAVCANGIEYSTGRLIALLGRHRGLRMEAFSDRREALAWLARQDKSSMVES